MEETRVNSNEIDSPLEPPDDEQLDSDESDNHSEDLIQRLDDEVLDEGEEEEGGGGGWDEEREEEERLLKEEQQMRDESGRSVLHLAASRHNGAQTLFSFLQNPAVNLAWRDDKYQTARDVANELGRVENVMSIDSFVLSIAAQGQLEMLEKLMLDGYDHLTDITDASKVPIYESGLLDESILNFLKSVDEFHEKVNKLHRAVRLGNLEQVKDIVRSQPQLAVALATYGRSALHVAVLNEEHSIAQFLANEVPETLKRGDNLERMPLHYAMGVVKVEKMARILVRAGGKRVVKDLRGRQPSYYFINREEIGILQEQEQLLKESN